MTEGKERKTNLRHCLFWMVLGTILLSSVLLISVFHSAEKVLSSLHKGETGKLVLSSFQSIFRAPEGWKVWLSQSEVVDVAFWNNRYFVATAQGGVVVYNENLERVSQITSLEGLPENAVRCLAATEEALWIGLAHYGLVALKNNQLFHYTFSGKETDMVTCLLVCPEGLLAGTLEHGVLKFENSSFRPIKYLSGLKVRTLASQKGTLAVGTQGQGLILYRGKTPLVVSRKQGMIADTVLDIVTSGEDFLVATLEGAFRVTQGGQAVCLLEGCCTAVADFFHRPWVASLNWGLCPAEGKSSSGQFSNCYINRMKTAGRRCFLLTEKGAYVKSGEEWEMLSVSGNLPAGFITCLAKASSGHLYAGSFESGLLVLEKDNFIRQTIDEDIRQVNCLLLEEMAGRLLAGTGAGLAFFDLDGNLKGLISEELLGAAVCGLCQYQDSVCCATGGAGICFLQEGSIYNLSRFQGLPNNHVYACTVLDGCLYAGTLAGVCVIQGRKITGFFTSANSGLPANWITSFCHSGPCLYAGTYGGGLARFSEGKWESLQKITGAVEVNNNCLVNFKGYVLAGTVRSGLLILDTRKQKCSTLTGGLPSRNVTALLVGEKGLYIGTDSGLLFIDTEALEKLLP